jgi:hypothetical protein
VGPAGSGERKEQLRGKRTRERGKRTVGIDSRVPNLEPQRETDNVNQSRNQKTRKSLGEWQ